MNVDNTNFDEKLINSIEQLMNQSQFVSFDLEMTGIRQKYTQQENFYDMPFHRYESLSQIAKKFSIIQIGLCFFKKLSNNNYEAHPFNFYIIAREVQPWIIKPIIQLEITSIEFNSEHGMDWYCFQYKIKEINLQRNRWLKHGINYLQKYNVDKIKKSIYQEEKKEKDQQQEESYEKLLSELDDDERKSYIWQKIQEIQCLATNQNQQSNQEKEEQKQVINKENNNINMIQLEGLRQFEKKIILTYLNQNHPNFIRYSDEDKNLVIVNEIGKKQFFDDKKQFYRIIEMIIEKNIELVGHNCITDMLFIYNSFIGNLPDDYFEYKTKMHQHFQNIYDTKQVIKLLYPEQFQKIQSTTLDNIKKYIQENPTEFSQVQISLPQNCKNYDFTKPENDIYSHEAGFDAYMTGWIYLKLTNNKNQNQILQVKNKFGLYQSQFMVCLSSDTLQADLRTNNSLTFVIRLNDDYQDRNRNDFSAQKKNVSHLVKQLKEHFMNSKSQFYINDNDIQQKQIKQQQLYQQKQQNSNQENIQQEDVNLQVFVKVQQNEIFIELKEEFIQLKQTQFIKDLLKIFKKYQEELKEQKINIEIMSLQKYMEQKTIRYKKDFDQRFDYRQNNRRY